MQLFNYLITCFLNYFYLMFRCCLHESQTATEHHSGWFTFKWKLYTCHLFSGASTRHGLSLSSAQFAILLSGFWAFVALTEVSQGGLQNKVFSPWTDGPTRVVQLQIGLLRIEPHASENGPYFSEIPLVSDSQ